MEERAISPIALKLRRKYYKCGGCEKVFDRGTHERVPLNPRFTESWSVCPHCFAENNAYSPKISAWTEGVLVKVFGLTPHKAQEIVKKYSAVKQEKAA